MRNERLREIERERGGGERDDDEMNEYQKMRNRLAKQRKKHIENEKTAFDRC